jgi:hypothetical protein
LTKLGHKIIRLLDTDAESFSVKVEFYDGALIEIRMRHIFEKPKGLTSEVLRGGMFDKCFIESGALAWPNGLELCPDAMRSWREVIGLKPHRRRQRA